MPVAASPGVGILLKWRWPAAGAFLVVFAMVAPHDPHATTYRLVGDPTAPLLDAPAVEVAHHPHPLEEAS